MINNGWHNKIINHDVTKPFPLEDGCIDVVVTSPPYWGLRDYGAEGQIGLEEHPQMYIDKLVGVCREIRRVLKKSGSFYLNLGDTYCGGGVGQKDTGIASFPPNNFRKKQFKKYNGGWLQPKQLMLIPMRVAIALQDDGWILRNDIIWYKPNSMPSSVKDRLNNTFEHVFHFVKSRKYYYNLDEIREPHKTEFRPTRPITSHGKEPNPSGCSNNLTYNKMNPNGKNPGDVIHPVYGEDKGNRGRMLDHLHQQGEHHYNDGGKNPGDFWNICTQPFTSYNAEMEHFAVFPDELIVKPIKASCPDGGVVLDPFCGRGTVGKVAKSLGFNYVLFDIKPEYCELARLYVNGQKRKLIKYQNKLEFKEN